jgi:hypothetical protein
VGRNVKRGSEERTPELLIFIDANVFLSPYRRRAELTAYKGLLRNLVDLAPYLLLTRTVRDEFERGRLQAYRGANSRPSGRPDLPEILLHHTEDHSQFEKFRKRSKALSLEYKKLLVENDANHERNLRAIALGEDDVSRIVTPLFAHAAVETKAQLERARERKERGQPPGKDRNVLGDQISWDQLLDASVGRRAIFVVTEDGDYADAIGGELILKTTLRRELHTIDGSLELRCFSELGKLFEAVRESRLVQVNKLPTAEGIKLAQEELRQAPTISAYFSPASVWPMRPGPCPTSPDGQHDFHHRRHSGAPVGV